MHDLILEGADHLQSGAVAHVGEALPGVAAEGALKDSSVLGAVEERAPVLELAHPVG